MKNQIPVTNLFTTVLIVALWISAPLGFGQTPNVSSEMKKQTIDELSTLLAAKYGNKETGQKLQELFQQNLKSGKYDSIDTLEEFHSVVNRELHSMISDRHLALFYSPEAAPTADSSRSNPSAPTAEERAREAAKFARQMNCGFKSIQFLNGNIGYLRLDYFDSYLDYARPVVDAALAFLRNSDAVVIDLRENGGGSGAMVGYLAGFFFDERTLVGTSYDRLTDTTSEEYQDPQPEEKRLSSVDLYVLTSQRTTSAAEALAYRLKYHRKAKVIGEPSAGAANPGRIYRLNTLFTAFIPNRYGKSSVTGTNWEGTGVPVDIACPAENALHVARIEGLKRMREKATDPQQIKKYGNYITYLEATRSERLLPEDVLQEYVGEYRGERTITISKDNLQNARLYYSKVADPGGVLHFISKDRFMLSEGDVTITFSRDEKDRVVGMETQWSLSDSHHTTRTVAARIK
jgi:retinol-binding protein 3